MADELDVVVRMDYGEMHYVAQALRLRGLGQYSDFIMSRPVEYSMGIEFDMPAEDVRACYSALKDILDLDGMDMSLRDGVMALRRALGDYL